MPLGGYRGIMTLAKYPALDVY